MKKLVDFIIKHRRIVVTLFVLASLISIFSQSLVKINYDLADYLPKDTASTKAIEVMSSQFEEEISNINVVITDTTISEAQNTKAKLKAIDEVTSVFWLDDYLDVTIPISISDQEFVDRYYKDNNALFMVTVETDNYLPVLSQLHEIAGEDGYVAGQMVDLAMAQKSVQSEVGQIIIFIIPIVALVLIFATHSWLEPIVMLLAIGVGILLNMGTNLIFGEVSFLTNSVASILQLAVSMDYAIFLLHKFTEIRKTEPDTQEAMRIATIRSMPTLMASSITTFIGFLALTLMRFQIGPDMGLVLAKGIFFSLLSVVFLLPCITIMSVKWIDKTTHKSFLPSFKKFSMIVFKASPIVIAMVLLVMVPSYLAQRKNDFIYGMGGYQINSREDLDYNAIKELYGEETQMVILVPKGQWANETAMIEAFEQYPEVKSIMSYITMIGPNIPYHILLEDQISSLVSKDYSRIILQVVSAEEGTVAFNLVERVRHTIDTYYKEEETHLVGSSVITYDMAQTIQADDIVVNGLAILAIFLTIMIIFKSLTIPIILVLAIEISIWINLSVPYFTQSPLSYIGFLIISTVQLGATIDYGVLFTQNYIDNRQSLFKKEALFKTIQQSASTILPPALILTVTGFVLGFISTITIVSELGWTLGRGALVSLLMILFFVPGVYYFLDGIVQKTTYKTKFKNEVIINEKDST